MVKILVRKSLEALISKQTNIFSAAVFIILTTILSQFLGLLKYRLLVSYFGASSDLGVFFAAFRIPDFLFQVVIAGALSSSFIPIFTDYIMKDKKEKIYSFTSSLITILTLLFILTSIIIIVFAYQLSSLIAPGYSPSELSLMSNIMRIIQLSQIFFIIGTVFTAMLQSYQHFLIPGIATSFYNIGIILGLLFFAHQFGIFGATIGVVIGSVLFCLVQLPLLKKTGYQFYFTKTIDEGVKKIFHLMLPRSLTLFISQVAITANVLFTSLISARSLVIFDLAQTLVIAQAILFGQSIAQASFPALSLKREKKEEFISIFISSFNQILYLTLPVSALLIVLRIPIVRLFFGASRFDWDATVATGLTLAFFSISIFAQALIYLFSRAFYALHDTKTPFFITVISVCLNIIIYSLYLLIYNNLSFINLLLGNPFTYITIVCTTRNICYIIYLLFRNQIYFLAFSYSLSSIFSILLLTITISKKIQLPARIMFVTILKIVTATFIMGLSLYLPIKLLDQLVFDTRKTINLIFLTSIASTFGLISYIFFTWLLNIQEAYYIVGVAKKLGDWKKIMKSVEELIDGNKLSP